MLGPLPAFPGISTVTVTGRPYATALRVVVPEKMKNPWDVQTGAKILDPVADGDTLVIDTVGFNDKSWLTSSMQPHTEDLHVVERYRMFRPGMIELRTTVEDRQALTSPYTYTRYYKRMADERPELICNPDEGDMRMWTEYRVKALKFGMLPVPAKESVPAKAPAKTPAGMPAE